MDRMTQKEASAKWGVSTHQINYYYASGRISGVVKIATPWLITKGAKNDGWQKQGRAQG